ncbi:DUF485 domain-containing protein [Streptomyces mangrovisoli]|uniref:DUF485 domain-containing protein n=1 Tax=Streptomyces mangrovisoli TaxID=1428628 RepID=A0A1J4NP89_9ACTN|nr:DUF485 domain-containing protein [Streptomyces mangrovisoli]OIJ62990.1 hypothetical protein WN71_036455 [Streptomyces mangrovisoli]
MHHDASPPYATNPYPPPPNPPNPHSPPPYPPPPYPPRPEAVPETLTYPWRPQAPPPRPERRRQPRPAPLGNHSDLRILRRAYRRQRRTATLAALGYFTLFLVLSAFAPDLMTGEVTDGLPTGLLLALLQVPVTCLAIARYERTARRRVDPLADRIRRQSEVDAKRRAAR